MSGPDVTDVAQLLVRFAASERPALSFYRGRTRTGRLTYAELAANVSRVAAHLATKYAIKCGDRVAVLSPNCLEVPLLLLGVMKLGAVLVPLNPTTGMDEWRYILQHAECDVLFASAELLQQFVGDDGLRSQTLESFVNDATGTGTPCHGGTGTELAGALAIVLYTSGTTGNPKGVGLSQRNLLSNAWSMAQIFSLRQTTQLAVLPLYHAHALGFGLMTALQSEGHLVFTERLDPFCYADVINAESVTVTSVVPTLLPMILQAGITHKKIPTLTHMLVSSAPLSADLARAFEEKVGVPIIQGWGLSEYTNFACCMRPDDNAEDHTSQLFSREVPSIGAPLAGTEVRVVDPDGNAVAADARGELHVRGHSTMLGYFRDADTTAKTLDADGWLRTGDEGFFVEARGHREFFITGRLKEIIIRDGEKASPLAIERQLLALIPSLAGKLVALGFPHRAHGEEVGAYIELPEVSDDLRADLARAIATLPVGSRPKVLLYGAAPIPRTHTGKIQRRKMHRWFAAYEDCRGALKILPHDVV